MNHLHNYLREKIGGVASATPEPFPGHAVYNPVPIDFSVSVRQYACVFSQEISTAKPRRCKNRRAKGRRVASLDPHRKNEVNPTFVNKDPAHFRRGGITVVAV